MDDGRPTPSGSPSSIAPSRLDPAQLPAGVEREICQYVAEELARFGRAGRPQIVGHRIQVRSGPHLDHSHLGDWAERWSDLDEPTRRLRAAQTARQLSSLRPPAPAADPPLLRRLAPFAALAVLAALAGWFFFLRSGSEDAPGAEPPRERRRDVLAGSAAERERSDRAARVCRATLERVVRGATVTLADSEGWVMEFRALRSQTAPPILDDPTLHRFFSEEIAPHIRRLSWAEEPSLLTEPNDALVRVKVGLIPRDSGESLEEFVATFSGPPADAYFRERTRPQTFHLAAALTEALHFDRAALYARCATGTTHHLGSWFGGRDHHLATTALMYAMGTFASPPHLSPAYYQRLDRPAMDRGLAHDNIAKVSALISRELLAGLVGRQGGMVMGRPGGLTTITFPFADGNRASRLSREIAREGNLAE